MSDSTITFPLTNPTPAPTGTAFLGWQVALTNYSGSTQYAFYTAPTYDTSGATLDDENAGLLQINRTTDDGATWEFYIDSTTLATPPGSIPTSGQGRGQTQNRFGNALGISDDGTLVAIGGQNLVAVYEFDQSTPSLTLLGSVLTGDTYFISGQFVFTVKIVGSANNKGAGIYLFFGIPGEQNEGKRLIFLQYDTGTSDWVTPTNYSVIDGSSITGSSTQFALDFSVYVPTLGGNLSTDGIRLILADDDNNEFSSGGGQVYYYYGTTALGWSATPVALAGSGLISVDSRFGSGVDISRNGKYLIIGQSQQGGNEPKVYVYENDTDPPAQGSFVFKTSTIGDNGSNFGDPVVWNQTNSNPTHFIVGAYKTSTDKGAVYIYDFTPPETISVSAFQPIEFTTANQNNSQLGVSVALDDRAQAALVGANGNSTATPAGTILLRQTSSPMCLSDETLVAKMIEVDEE
jgi:hypothetical protein